MIVRLTNPTFERLFGYGPNQLVGQSLEPLIAVPGHPRRKFERIFREHTSPGGPPPIELECVRKDGFHFLQAHVNADPADPRADEMFGDILREGKPLASWGLHSIDINLTMGNLLDVVDAQSKAYLAQTAHAHR